MQISGVDEAGRGSMLGPLVVAGVVMGEDRIKYLSKLGVKDSKRLSPKSRQILYHKIIEIVDDYSIMWVHPRSIDASVRLHRLNILEAKYMARIISRLDSDVSYVDSCDVNSTRFGNRVSDLSGHEVKSYHHADQKFLVVSAASILAKVSRDSAIARLRKLHDLGSGYPSDRTTVRFVTQYYQIHQSMPSFVRKSWKPVKRIMNHL